MKRKVKVRRVKVKVKKRKINNCMLYIQKIVYFILHLFLFYTYKCTSQITGPTIHLSVGSKSK